MFYTVYQITNLINGKIYVGSHITSNLDDGYMGSGKMLHRAFEKYGIENFEKKILSKHKTKELMYRREAKIVNEEFVKREDTYNIKIGGHGGWDHIAKGEDRHWTHKLKSGTKETRLKGVMTSIVLAKKDPNYWLRIVNKRKNTFFKETGFYHNLNGKKCITNIKLKQNKIVAKNLLDFYYSQGWVDGFTYFNKVGTQSTKLKEVLIGFKNLLKAEKEKLFNKVDSYTEFQFKRKTEILKKKQDLIESEINFEAMGWVQEASKILLITPQKVGKWMQREFPELYKFCKQRG